MARKTIRGELKKTQEELSQANSELTNIKQKNLELSQENKQFDSDIKERDSKVTSLSGEVSTLQKSNDESQKQINDLKNEKGDLQQQLDENETKRLAEAFAVVADKYEEKQDSYMNWVKWGVITIASVGVIYFGIATIFTLGWNNKLNFLSFYGMLVFGLYFLVRQYSFYRNLFVDMRHRQTLAQSYYNILRSVEDKAILPQLAEKTVAFLTTPPHVKEDDLGAPMDALTNSIKDIGDKQ